MGRPRSGPRSGAARVTSSEILKETIWLLVTEGRVSYRRLRREFDLDDEALEDVRIELIDVKRLASDKDGQFLLWSPAPRAGDYAAPTAPREQLAPLHASGVPASRATGQTESGSLTIGEVTTSGGERRQLTVMFCDLVGSTALSTRLDPEDLQDFAAFGSCAPRSSPSSTAMSPSTWATAC